MGEDRLKEEAREKLIFALDVSGRNAAEQRIQALAPYVGLFKIGLELFVREGRHLLEYLSKIPGRPSVFLDLKFHDIRETVVKAQASASEWAPRFLSIHSDVGRDGLAAAAAAAKQTGTDILVVTVLTNLGKTDLKELGFAPEYVEDPSKLVLKRAGLAYSAVCRGVICSGHEAAAVKAMYPNLLVVTPGIRPTGPEWSEVPNDDQKRKTTPREAILAGADYIVVGRPIRDHRNPVEAAKLVVEEIKQALIERESLSLCNTPLAETPRAANC